MRLTASVVQEGAIFVAQCLEIDVASQGNSLDEALVNLREALELRFEGEPPPSNLRSPVIAPIDVKIA
jgi:predicted RNase H-like HicB family nuclease